MSARLVLLTVAGRAPAATLAATLVAVLTLMPLGAAPQPVPTSRERFVEASPTSRKRFVEASQSSPEIRDEKSVAARMRDGVVLRADAYASGIPLGSSAANAAVKPRARTLGVPFDGTAGPLNAITDVVGVEVGVATIIAGEGALGRGRGPVRTGVTAVLPRGRSADNVFAGWHTLNGNGEMTGTTWITESGFLEGPILITNTHSVGVARDTAVEWMARYSDIVPLPVAAETYDGTLNDILGFHVKREHVLAALDGARPGAVAEGNVGGGTGMIAFGFKGGTGTASRVVTAGGAEYTVGALVQANFGRRSQFLVAGVPVGREIADLMPETGRPPAAQGEDSESGSIIVVIATNAPLLPHQLRRLAQRAGLGVARVGGSGGNGSGDIFVAFSTANPATYEKPATAVVTVLSNDAIDPLFQGSIQATEEAIINAIVAAETMTGRDGNRVHALPHDRLRSALRKYNRLSP